MISLELQLMLISVWLIFNMSYFSSWTDSMDPEFELTAEMMVEGEDYEGTLDDEEEDEIEDENELADLQKVLL